MAGIDPIPSKKRKFDTPDDIFEQFKRGFKNMNDFKGAYKRLTKSVVILSEIKACNAGVGYGISFSNSTCETKQYITEVFPFGSFFCPALEMLNKYFLDPDTGLPKDYKSRMLMAKLMSFLMDETVVDNLKKVSNEHEIKSKTVVTAILSRHYLAKLIYGSKYILDEHYCTKSLFGEDCYCKCAICNVLGNTQFGDTSIGNYRTWHGSLDVVFGNFDAFVHIIDNSANSGNKDKLEVKPANLKDLQSRSQIFSQTITFSFLQKKRDPDQVNMLIPGIALSRNEIQFVFYDCENDYLLETFEMKLLNFDNTLNYEAVIATWLVLNHEFFCSGITSRVANAPKSNFIGFAGDFLDLYKNELQFQNAKNGKAPRFLDETDISRLDTRFVWPSDLEKYNTNKI